MTGKIDKADCNVSGGGDNAGCGITTTDSKSYGAGLNSIQGGVYATEVTASQITVWFFPRSSIPQDIKSGSPNPSGWSKPQAVFKGCDVKSHFQDMQIVFDTTFCGDWAGAVWSSDSTCSSKAATCQDYVKNHPEGFKEAYWRVNSLKVYSGSSSGGAAPQSSGGAPSQTKAAQTGKASQTAKASNTKGGQTVKAADVGDDSPTPTPTPSAYTPRVPTGTPYERPTPSAGSGPGAQGPGAGGHPFSYGGHGGRGRPTNVPNWDHNQKHRRHLVAHMNGQRAGHA